MGIIRKTYVIDEKGNIERIFDKVDTKNHTEQILETYN
jgi:peroxiredoxin Q/BCP